jgi:2-polyprenyl-6-methoxyphenol hydroxylase-like FAD-dependent oxidoreductase
MGDIREAQVDGQPKPLHILIAGAGIGGLSAAIALRQQGHQVDIFEQSKLSQETGAAIHLASNCNGLLRRMGLMAEQIGGVECTDVIEYLPHNGQVKYHIPAKKMSEKLWAHPWHLVHRAHLHTALREMAINPEGKGPAAKLHLASRVQRLDAATATVVLADGTEFQGDVVIGADGVHSKARASIPGGDLQAFDSGKSAFRFLIPTETLMSDPKTAAPIKPSSLTMWIGEDRRVIMYPCMSNTMMNFVLIHPSAESQADVGDEGMLTPLPWLYT